MRLIIYVVVLVTAMGGLVFGFDSGIIATTFGHESFRIAMYGPSQANPALTGAIVSVYNAGQAISGSIAGYLADKISRRYTISFAAFLSIVGAALQAGATHVGMMIAGRLVAGVACGSLLAVVPIYIAEVAPPKDRGFLVGLQGMMVAVGFGLANWVGYAGAFASGSATWRIPLAMQIPFPALLTVAVLFVPYSPRWLIMQDRIEEAKQVLLRLHGGDADGSMLVAQEIIQIQEQLHLEQQQQQGANWVHALKAMFSRQYVRRTNYQTIFYAMVGFTGRKSLLISGVYGMMAVIGGAIYLLFVADKWPRARTMWVGSFILAVNISICMALSARYGDGSAGSEDGARAAIAFIFIFSAVFAIFFNSMIWVVPSELFPMFLRSKGMAFAVFSKSVTAIVLSQVTPIALADVGWRFYALFISTNVAAGVLYFFFLPETVSILHPRGGVVTAKGPIPQLRGLGQGNKVI
ncbi:sugar transporter, partial [Fusarium albosuccineum]